MATQEDARRICSRLPGAVEGDERFGFAVTVKGKSKGFCWSWAERVDPKKARVINDDVLAISVPSLTIKDLLLSSGSPALFTEPHYNGYPAVLVRLDAIGADELEDLLVEAWKCKAPKELVQAFDRDREA
jgi:hypothetical protein